MAPLGRTLKKRTKDRCKFLSSSLVHDVIFECADEEQIENDAANEPNGLTGDVRRISRDQRNSRSAPGRYCDSDEGRCPMECDAVRCHDSDRSPASLRSAAEHVQTRHGQRKLGITEAWEAHLVAETKDSSKLAPCTQHMMKNQPLEHPDDFMFLMKPRWWFRRRSVRVSPSGSLKKVSEQASKIVSLVGFAAS
eukprot:TRINITY_DN40155_c0_g1_i1.p1 TRINITY_DN40155_c0_g1~~TRINITY_DN40155_c0_g1_i1.p1  ORF type:complete len:210 (-),score=26.39 TRINITY_DN40155_c0_g1_i1:467-1048(-)